MNKIKLLEFITPDYFINSVNHDIKRLNFLIDELNAASQDDKTEILVEIYYYQKTITDKYPAVFNLLVPQYQQTFQVELFNELKKEFLSLGCESVSKSAIDHFELTQNANKNGHTKFQLMEHSIEKTDKPKQVQDLFHFKQKIRMMLIEDPNLENRKELRALIKRINAKSSELHPEPKQEDRLVAWLANADVHQLEQLTLILVSKKSLNAEELASFCSPEEIELFKYYQITFLGGTRSKNFEVKSETESFVLKVDNRWNAPKSVESRLVSSSLKDTITPLLADRVVAVQQEPIAELPVNSSALVITEFCSGGNLAAHRMQPFIHKNPEQIIKSAMHIYKKMAEILITFKENNAAFPDLKNVNWLLDDNGNLRLADTKAFLPAKEGKYDPNSVESHWYGLLHTPYLSPPEFAGGEKAWDVDAAQAYMLGKNLYQYITNCGNEFLKEKTFFFHDPIFATDAGKKIRGLIERLIQEDPNKRPSLADALATLTRLDCKLNGTPEENAQKAAIKVLKQECLILLNKMSQCTVGAQDPQMNEFKNLCGLFIETVDSESALHEFLLELEHLNKVSPRVRDITSLISKLRDEGKNDLFSIGKTAKAERIEAALGKVPVEKRHMVMDAQNGNAEVQMAIASQRHVGKLKNLFFKSSNIEDNAAASFGKTKDHYKKLVSETSEQIDSEKNETTDKQVRLNQ